MSPLSFQRKYLFAPNSDNLFYVYNLIFFFERGKGGLKILLLSVHYAKSTYVDWEKFRIIASAFH